MVSVTVCLIAKNEGPYLLEWIAFYRNLGFDKIVVYENNSTDSSAQLLASLAKAGKIIYRPWPLGATESPQITAYADAIRHVDTDWIYFTDCDEFLILHKGSLKEMLAPLHERQEVTAIGINWRIFGSSHLTDYEDRPVIERFTMAAPPDFVMNNHLKSFLRVGSIGEHIDMHLSATSGRVVFADGTDLETESQGRSQRIDLSLAQVNHYYTKTRAEYEVKIRRGQAGIGEDSDIKYWYNSETFLIHDQNEVQDLSAAKYLPSLRREMSSLAHDIKPKRFVFPWTKA